MSTSPEWGPELRRLRHQAGYTLTELALTVNYSKGYLSKMERGKGRPSPELIHRLDALLRTGGALRKLAETSLPRPNTSSEGPNGGPEANLRHWELDRRDILESVAAPLIDKVLKRPGNATAATGTPLLDALATQLDQSRRLGQCSDPAVLLPVLESQTRDVVGLVSRADARHRIPLLLLASRFAEFAGWMAQEAGNTRTALSWTADAVLLAEAGGDQHLASYAFVRRALITFYDNDASATIGLAARAQSNGRVPPRIRGLAAQREAQGHALAGDELACMRALERARRSLASAAEEAGPGPVIGTTNLPDPAAMVTGWCLYDLGSPREAAQVLDREFSGIPSGALRTRTRYGIRRALAHAASGEIEHSCAIAQELLDVGVAAPSATVRTDIRRLAAELGRFRTHRAVRDLQPALAWALRPARI
ncbi:helix-turn-helix domain-containing protein [Streptomyces sp. NBC_00091]|uniref:helix-turn-helix domain-containing protein n=1 Tax=Streptomyces sp. NBC_00091 TaxID=2975648 RepID=UPI0022552FAB|nr:helix-turn-helix transcriptional regulator [Streptomyces sp. NBC_00091]MCX5375860.1 helix-turn-helix domain-containing protein [Streptomyces sp. NBC_00091]